MQLKDKVEIRGDALTVYRVYPNGRVEVAYTEVPLQVKKPEDTQDKDKHKIVWDLT